MDMIVPVKVGRSQSGFKKLLDLRPEFQGNLIRVEFPRVGHGPEFVFMPELAAG